MAASENAYVYMLRCADGSLYSGWTSDVQRRLAAHNAGTASRCTRARRPVSLVYLERRADRGDALRREAALKKLTRAQKLTLIARHAAETAAETVRACGEAPAAAGAKKKGSHPMIPTTDQAREILKQYNKEEFHLRHGEIVSGVMRWFAREYDPENAEYWAAVGMLHDLDFEQWPEEHCVRERELMRSLGIDEDFIRACVSHGWGMTGCDVEPQRQMEKVLFAVDELTGLIGAVAIMRPSKSVGDLELKSVKKKFKTPAFAAGCSREIISQGAEMLGVDLDELIEKTILAMRSLMGTMEI